MTRSAISRDHEHAGNGKRQRVVILPGPHKTATTSVQSLLDNLSKSGKLGTWDWPASRETTFGKVLNSVLFDPRDSSGVQKQLRINIKKAWKRGKSIVFGNEDLDYIAVMSPDEARAALKRVRSLLPQDIVSVRDISVAVTYRTPRSSHLVSAWKQQIAMGKTGRNWNSPWRTVIGDKPTSEPPPLSEWLCHGIWEGRIEFNIANITAGWLNPMGLANAFVRFGNVNAIIGDMSGMADVPNTVACEVLQIPCTNDGHIVGRPTKKSIVRNRRSNPTELGMKDADLDEAEEILRRMDCYYYCGLRDSITVLHATDDMFTESEGWNKCCESPESFLKPSAAYIMLKNLGCRASEKGVVATKSSISSKVIKQSSLSDNPMMIQSNLSGGTAKRPILLDEESIVQQNVFSYSKGVNALLFPGVVWTIVFFAASYRKRGRSKQHLAESHKLPCHVAPR